MENLFDGAVWSNGSRERVILEGPHEEYLPNACSLQFECMNHEAEDEALEWISANSSKGNKKGPWDGSF